MSQQLEEALKLLARYRDTYLANHQTEKTNINAVLAMDTSPATKDPEAPKVEKKKKK